MNDHSLWKELGKLLAALFIPLNDLDMDPHAEKLFGQIVCHRSTADDHGITDLMCPDTDLFDEISCLGRACHNTDRIACFDNKTTIWDHDLILAFYRTYQNIRLDLMGNIDQAAVIDR